MTEQARSERKTQNHVIALFIETALLREIDDARAENAVRRLRLQTVE